MATKAAPRVPHTSGLFADMTLDGPEIGTLVIVFDRAKNLPSRTSMSKQNPYCAARLGKEAKKTQTDQRGGQTPRWDEELRFIVHDSPDYQRIKISVFSEGKRTDLIGEAWVDLTEVIVPGGGKRDLWQSLLFKSKYAGELRMELTYYDERPKPAETPSKQDMAQGITGDSSRVKRRPLPSNPLLRNLTPDTIPEPAAPGRAKHGPRDFRTPPRANSMPPEVNHTQSQPGYIAPPHAHAQPLGSSPGYQQSPQAPYRPQEEPQSYQNGPYELPDFLPQLPPSNRPRGSLPAQQRFDTGPDQISLSHQQGSLGLQHSQSSPAVPTSYHHFQEYDDGPQLRTEYPEPIPDIDCQHQQIVSRSRSSEAMRSQRNQYSDPYTQNLAFQEQEQHAPPPPPPMHSNSSPAVPQRSSGHPMSSPSPSYGMTPPSARHHSIPTSSPLQNLERKYMTPPRPAGQDSSPARGSSFDSYTPSPEPLAYGSSPVGYSQGQTPSPQFRPQPASRSAANRHSIADPYYASTPPRPHPLSKEVPQTQSPPELQSAQTGPYPIFPTQYRSRDGLPLIKPRPVSPQNSSQPPSQPSSFPQSRSLYEIQFPIRAFESSDKSPLSTSQPNARGRGAQLSNGSTPIRKSISPHPTPPASAGAVPYSPDSFNIHNPNSQSPLLPSGNSPHSPYQIRPGSEGMPQDMSNGPIMDSHGNEIDPSDRLPVNSWAPEPEKKTPTRTYGIGRDRDFGPRSPQSGEPAGGKNLSKDTVINVRSRAQTQPAQGEPTPIRNRLQKKSTPTAKNPGAIQPLQERHNYNSMSMPHPDTDQHYGRGVYGQPWGPSSYEGSYAEMSEEALSREISGIDIGGARHARSGSVPAPTAFVPVRSHKDRRTLY